MTSKPKFANAKIEMRRRSSEAVSSNIAAIDNYLFVNRCVRKYQLIDLKTNELIIKIEISKLHCRTQFTVM